MMKEADNKTTTQEEFERFYEVGYDDEPLSLAEIEKLADCVLRDLEFFINDGNDLKGVIFKSFNKQNKVIRLVSQPNEEGEPHYDLIVDEIDLQLIDPQGNL